MDTLRMQKWEKTRSKGKNNFILKTGVLYWGISTGVLWSIFMFFQGESRTIARFLAYFIPALILFPIGGLFWGLWVWNITEKKYRKLKDQSDNA